MTSVLEPVEAAPPNEARRAVLRHRRGTRWMHWINFPLISIMIWSGLRIYWAEDIYAFGILDWEIFAFFPDWFYGSLNLERRLARGLAFHLSFAWLFVLNGVAYGIYTTVTSGWGHLLPRREVLDHGGYKRGQRLAYSFIVALGGLAVLTGFAIFKPTQLGWLTAALGGYEMARRIHFAITITFVVFFMVHVLQVARAGWHKCSPMLTGYELIDPDV